MKLGSTSFFTCVGLGAGVGAHVGNFDRLAVFIRAFKGNLAGLGLPLPLVSSFEESGNFSIPGVADGLNFIPRIDTEGLGDLIENWRALSAPRKLQQGPALRKPEDQSWLNGGHLSWSSLLGELNGCCVG